MLQNAEVFLNPPERTSIPCDFRQQIFYRVLIHTKFANRELLAAVERYRHNLSMLVSLDFVNPVAAIRSAENEIRNSLQYTGARAAERTAQLHETVRTQKQHLSELKKRWLTLFTELCHIARFVRDALSTMEIVSDASIAILTDCEVARKKERQRIEDIKAYFKTQLKNEMCGRQVTRRHLERAKIEFDQLSNAISTLGSEDISAMTGIYEGVRSYAKQIADAINALLVELENRKDGSVKENKDLLAQIAQVLVSLLSDYRFELKTAEYRDAKTDQVIIRAIRKEVLYHLFDVVQKERRSLHNRRSGKDRRKATYLNYTGLERRSRRDRRTMQSRMHV